MQVEIKSFGELSIKELYEILKLRSEIFVVEQNCVYNDVDGKDYESAHAMLKEDGEIQAYVRLIPKGLSYDTYSIGRVIVRETARRRGLGIVVMKAGIEYITETLGENKITIGAQEYLREFYGLLGFKPISDMYLEDGIPHIDMVFEK